jgi:diguanylate cyclase (GGDEF)-like protein
VSARRDGFFHMDTREIAFGGDGSSHLQAELRQQVAALLLDRAEMITSDTVAIFPYAASESLDVEYCTRIGHVLVQLLAIGVRDARVDARGSLVADLYSAVLERPLSTEQLFTFAYLVERTALDELALDDRIGATSDPWPVVAQLIRRAIFDLLAAHTAHAQLDPAETTMFDRLTTLFTRALFETVLAKEVDRASRYVYPISVILFDVDNLSVINKEHGYGVGDRILERLGILIRGFFRQHDWIARYSEDEFAVLLTGSDAGHAGELAERVRATVEERLEFTDHRTDLLVRVTVSASAINMRVKAGDVIDPARLMADAEAAMDRAKQQGRNRVERVDGYTGAAAAT